MDFKHILEKSFIKCVRKPKKSFRKCVKLNKKSFRKCVDAIAENGYNIEKK